jgi:hypothetical protein
LTSPHTATLEYHLSLGEFRSIGAFIESPNRVGNDGLTDAEREQDRIAFIETVGRKPLASPERRDRLSRLSNTIEARRQVQQNTAE